MSLIYLHIWGNRKTVQDDVYQSKVTMKESKEILLCLETVVESYFLVFFIIKINAGSGENCPTVICRR